MRLRNLLLITMFLTLLASCSAEAMTVKTMATGLKVPWGMAFVPGGDALVSERATGRILRVPHGGGHARVVMHVPGVVADEEAGLLGIAVSPTYSRDHLVYAYESTASDNRVVRFRLGGKVQTVLTGIRRARFHDGGRIAFGPDRRLYVAVGDGTRGSDAQDPTKLNGKILRVTPGGRPAPGNPIAGSPVWSLGHRNVQGLAWDGAGRLWATEFGQKTVDEVNLIVPGANYGWPTVEGGGDTQGGRFTDPKVTWTPTSTSSPSGAAIRGSTLYVAALQCRCLWRIPLNGATAGTPTKLLSVRYGRLRTVVRAPNGDLWVTTSNTDGRGTPAAHDDRILRVHF